MLDLETVLARTEEVTREVIGPQAEAVDRERRWPEEGIRALLAAGLGGLGVPKRQGGLGLGLHGLARLCEIVGAACPSTALCFGMHVVGSAVIAAKATPEQQQRYLDPIVAGRHLTTLALSEPGSGAHFYFPQTRLEIRDEELAVSGTKSFVTNGGHADSYVLSAVADGREEPVGEFTCVVVPEGTSGLAWGEPWHGLGMRGNSSRTVELQEVRLPRTNLLGRPGDQIWYVFHVVAPYFLSAMAGTYLGVAAAAVEEARAHLVRREYGHSGQLLANLPLLQHRMGTLWARVERTRRLIYHATAEGDSGDEGALLGILSAKAEVAECAVDVVNDAMTLAGGIAYRDNSRLERLLRDARAAHVMAPTTDILRTWAGRLILDQPLLGD